MLHGFQPIKGSFSRQLEISKLLNVVPVPITTNMKLSVLVVILQYFVLILSHSEFNVGTNNEYNMEMKAAVPVR